MEGDLSQRSGEGGNCRSSLQSQSLGLTAAFVSSVHRFKTVSTSPRKAHQSPILSSRTLPSRTSSRLRGVRIEVLLDASSLLDFPLSPVQNQPAFVNSGAGLISSSPITRVCALKITSFECGSNPSLSFFFSSALHGKPLRARFKVESLSTQYLEREISLGMDTHIQPARVPYLH